MPAKAKSLTVVDNVEVDEQTRYLLDQIGRFRKQFAELPIELWLNPSSDSISVDVNVVGYDLDNAHGDYISIDGITKGFQEIVLVVETFYDGRNNGAKGGKFIVEKYNLATMLAALRKYGPQYPKCGGGDAYQFESRALNVLKAIRELTKECGADMHEPDNYGIEAYVEGNKYRKGYDDMARPNPVVVLVKDNAIRLDMQVLDLLFLMGSIRRV